MKGRNVLAFCAFLFSTRIICTAVDTIGANQSIEVGTTLVSSGGSFELGFFSPGDSKSWYVGIWYKSTANRVVVWVANREKPLNDTNGVLKVTEGGLLVVLNLQETIIWSSNSSRSSKNTVAQLLDSGNLVVKDPSDNYLWQSFDYPGDTLLPGMKLGLNMVKGQEWSLTSWKSDDDPAQGGYERRIDPGGYPQSIVTQQGLGTKSRLGPWNGLGFSGYTLYNPNPYIVSQFIVSQEEIFYRYDLNSTVLSRLVLNPSGFVERFILNGRKGDWQKILQSETDQCDSYKFCGAYGVCNISSTLVCECLEGFQPKNSVEWSNKLYKPAGCERKIPLECGEKDVFIRHPGVKLPDTHNSWYNVSMSLGECKTMCSKNCSCTAYANVDVRNGGTGCFLWFGNLVDIKESNTNSQDLYVRVASGVPGMITAHKLWKKLIPAFVAAFLLLSIGVSVIIWKKKKQQLRRGRVATNFQPYTTDESWREDSDVKLFDFVMIVNATNNFSTDNKIGEGGFGPVYKGVLEDGQEIAVKKLARNSEQGNDEFKNEVIYIAKLQHRNLVKLLGYCLHGAEKMLIYEYLLHKSLDTFIFDPKHSKVLDWSKRLDIIKGTARGLLYLHQDSRLRIIHRDLKASNILLDYGMTPKISDFGTARSFIEQDSEGTTKRIVGTYGYISPEYAMHGLYSVKSDVFSYGVVVLEIVSGKTNMRFHHPEHRLNLIGHAWNLFQEGRQMELIDSSVQAASDWTEVLRAIHVGLLCVQQCPEDRPNMASVVLMLEGESALRRPEQPGFYDERNLLVLLEASLGETSSVQHNECSINMVSITQEEGR